MLDVGCGTGKSLPALSRAVGPTGRVIAIEPCAEMMRFARARVRELSLSNVDLIEAPAAALCEAIETDSIDAVLMMFTHDVLQSSAALDHLLAVAKNGARFVLAGGKLFSGALSLLNPWVEWRQKPYCTTFENYDAPWRKLFDTQALSATCVHPRYMGIAYIAHAVRAK